MEAVVSSASPCQRRGSRAAGAMRLGDVDGFIVGLPGLFLVGAA
jgi:hypothetical protein